MLRLPGFIFRILGIDDSDFTVIARAIAHGAMPYRDVVDIKPPLAFLLYLPNAISNALWPVQLEGALFVVATALCLGLFARRAWESEEAGIAAAFLSLAVGLCEAPTVSTELLMNLPTAAGLALFARAEVEGRKRDDLLAGILLGLAALIRHQAIFTLGTLGLATLLLGIFLRRDWFLRCTALAIAFALPWFCTLAIFHLLGALPEFIEWVFARNFGYVSQGAGSALMRCLQSIGVCIVAAAPLAWWAALSGAASTLRSIRSRAELASPAARLRLIATALLAISFVPVSLGGRFYEHYFLQLVPAAAIVGAGPLATLVATLRTRRAATRAALTALALLPMLGNLGYVFARGVMHQYPLQNEKVIAIGDWVRANTTPSDRLFVWGHFSPIYLASERLPATRYLTTSWHVGNFDPGHLDDSIDLRRFVSQRDVERTVEDLAKSPRALIIDTSPADIHSWHRIPLTLVPGLDEVISRGWVEVARPGGARVLQRRTLSGH